MANTDTAELSKHTTSGDFTLNLDASCEVSMTQLPTCADEESVENEGEDEEGSAATLIGYSMLFLFCLIV